MRQQHSWMYFVATLLAFVLAACGTSKPPAENPSAQTTETTVDQTPRIEQKSSNKVDTVNASVQNTKKPEYQPTQTSPPSTALTGSFTVQAGAYKMQDNAERIASLAKERFNRTVNVVYDNTTGLYKVMVGTFSMKDDARQFRDHMVQQFPTDYRDAWVSELTQK